MLTAASIHDPVLVIENRTLYLGEKADVELRYRPRPMGWHHRRRPGTDVTVVTCGAISGPVLEAAAMLADEQIDAEVLEMVWLNPLDTGALISSVARTGRLAVVHEANRTGGFVAEIAARVVEPGARLHAPPVRIAPPDVRPPAAPVLANALVPSARAIADGLRSAVRQAIFTAGVTEMTPGAMPIRYKGKDRTVDRAGQAHPGNRVERELSRKHGRGSAAALSGWHPRGYRGGHL